MLKISKQVINLIMRAMENWTLVIIAEEQTQEEEQIQRDNLQKSPTNATTICYGNNTTLIIYHCRLQIYNLTGQDKSSHVYGWYQDISPEWERSRICIQSIQIYSQYIRKKFRIKNMAWERQRETRRQIEGNTRRKIYIYIYIERERGRGRDREREI